jgi:hypothetical protein
VNDGTYSDRESDPSLVGAAQPYCQVAEHRLDVFDDVRRDVSLAKGVCILDSPQEQINQSHSGCLCLPGFSSSNTRCLLAFQSPGLVADRLMLFRIAGTGLENMQLTPAALLLVPGVPTTTSNQYVLV